MDDDQKISNGPRDAVFAYYPMEELRREDEIRLVDLWLVLARRKTVFFTVAGLILAAGLAYALFAPPKYQYTALIELGSVSTDSGTRVVEAASTALAKIDGAYLPAVLADYLKTQPEGTEPPEIRASIPKGSEVLTLTVDGTEEEGATLVQLQAAVIDRLAKDHASFIDVERRALRANIMANKNNLEQLENTGKALDSQAKRIEQLSVTLRGQRSEVARQLDAAISLERNLRSGADAASSDVASRLQANVETRALREQLLQLDERVTAALPKALDELRMAADGNAREILAQQERIADLESRLADVRDTRAIRPPTRSLEKIGPGSVAITIIAAISGVLIGIIAAFMAENVKNVWSEAANVDPNLESGSS